MTENQSYTIWQPLVPLRRSPAALIASHTSWRRLWDAALDKGVKGTHALQTLFKELCRPSSCFKCSLCDRDVPLNTSRPVYNMPAMFTQM